MGRINKRCFAATAFVVMALWGCIFIRELNALERLSTDSFTDPKDGSHLSQTGMSMPVSVSGVSIRITYEITPGQVQDSPKL